MSFRNSILSGKLFGRIPAIFVLVCLPVLHSYAEAPAPVAATGQTTSYAAGDDGENQSGVAWPVPRFVDNNDGTITDLLTNLVWLKDAGCLGLQNWDAAIVQVAGLSQGSCGLSDDSVASEWRVPNVLELSSLVDFGKRSPALPDAHPFTGVVSDFYWSSTTLDNVNNRGRTVGMNFGHIDQSDKPVLHYVWPVRDL